MKFENSKEFKEYLLKFKSNENIDLNCSFCDEIFTRTKRAIRRKLCPSNNTEKVFCSQECYNKATKSCITCSCKVCGKEVIRQKNQFDRSKSGFVFCSHTCAATYTNTSRLTGTRRSQMEIYLGEKVKEEFPTIELVTNNKSLVGLDLDFYFPGLDLAVEVNGITHYKPIFGEKSFLKTIERDKIKKEKCCELGIDLYTMDISQWGNLTSKSKVACWQELENKIVNKLQEVRED